MTAVIAAFAFGVPYSVRSNRWISDFSLRESIQHNRAPIFTQADIQFSGETGIYVKYIDEEIGHPPPTLRIARWIVKEAIALRAQKIIIIAALPHVRRCLRDIKMAIRESDSSIQVLISKEITTVQEDDWFDSRGTQFRAAAKVVWVIRDALLMSMPFWIYERVAS